MSPAPDLAADLEAGTTALGLELDRGQHQVLLDYLALLARWNRTYNLTAVREPAQMVTRHLLDCLAVAPLLHGTRVLDVGSGAGLPGIVLAVAFPQLQVVLLDGSLKRTRFLVHAVRELALGARVEVLRARFESLAPVASYDTLVSRASLPLPALMAAAPALLAPGGRLLAMLGQAGAWHAAAPPPGYVLRLQPLDVPGLEATRHAVVLEAA